MEKRTQFNVNMLPSIIAKIKRLASRESIEPGRYVESVIKKVKEPEK